MRTSLLSLIILLALAACQKASLSIHQPNQNKTIVLQPLGGYDSLQLQLLQNELHNFFGADIQIKQSIPLPPMARLPDDAGYNADTLLPYLLNTKDNSAAVVIGLTQARILTRKERNAIEGKGQKQSYWHQIIGLGYISEQACVITDYSLQSTDNFLWHTRLRNAVLHEVGHNLGLAHCTNEDCLMSKRNGELAMLTKSGRDFCAVCKSLLK